MPSDDMLGATLSAATQTMIANATVSVAADDDRRLAAQCASGDTAVFERIYRMHGERMKSIAYNHLGNASDAEDAVQETFLKVHRAASTYSGEASFSTWMYRILINTCYDVLRKRQRRPEEQEDDRTFERTAPSVDDTKRIARAIRNERRRSSAHWLQIAASIIVIAGLAVVLAIAFRARNEQKNFEAAILRDSAIQKVDAAQQAHVAAIAQLEKLAEPKLE